MVIIWDLWFGCFGTPVICSAVLGHFHTYSFLTMHVRMFTYWSDTSLAQTQEEGPVFWTGAYFCDRNIAMQINMEHSLHLLITRLIIWEIYPSRRYSI